MKENYDDVGNEVRKDDVNVDKALKEPLVARPYHVEQLKLQTTQLAKLKITNASLNEALAWRESQVSGLNKAQTYLTSEIERLKRAIASNEEALAWRSGQVEELSAQVGRFEGDIAHLQAEYDAILIELDTIRTGTGWKVVVRLCDVRDRILPQRTHRRRAYENVMALVKFLLGQ